MNYRGGSRAPGFTIVELLIVIVVIAILAAITVVAFRGIQDRAHNSAMQTDLRNLGQKVAEFAAINGRPPLANGTELGPILKVNKKPYLETVVGAEQTTLLYCRTDEKWGFIGRSKGNKVLAIENGSFRTVSNWGGSSDSSACRTNATVGFLYDGQPQVGWTNLYRGGEWQSWVMD